MKTRTLTALLLTLIILMSVGTAFALINNSYSCLPTCITPQCDVIFTYVSTCDNEVEKDVGHTCAWITNCKHTIQVSICNAYPCYRAYIEYKIKNIGNCPVHFDSVRIVNPNPEALEITTTNFTCTWLQPCQLCQPCQPCETVKGNTTVHIIQTAQECHTYEFEIKIDLSCQEIQHPCTIGFWKNQFSASLNCKGDPPQVNPTTLEQLLNQISAKSKIFKFTGTRTQKFQQALNILNIPQNSNMEAKLKAQLLALWLNYASDWTTGYTLNGMTAYQIIQGSENALKNRQTSQYENWKNLCDKFNNLT